MVRLMNTEINSIYINYGMETKSSFMVLCLCDIKRLRDNEIKEDVVRERSFTLAGCYQTRFGAKPEKPDISQSVQALEVTQ